jgi:hypothetical protein
MTNRIVIPETVEGLRGLTMARGWERAAWVYAWTSNDGAGQPRKNSVKIPNTYSLSEFAKLGLIGFRSDRTVRNYYSAWQAAIDAGKAHPVKPGDSPSEPDMKFPPGNNPAWAKSDWDDDYAKEAEAEGVSFGTAKRAGANKAAIKAAIKADPEVAKAAQEALNKMPVPKSKYGKTNTPTYDYVEDDVDDYSEEDDSRYSDRYEATVVERDSVLTAMTHLSSAAAVLNEAAESLIGVNLTPADKEKLEIRVDRVVVKVDMLRASLSSGSIDDALKALLSEGIE